MNAMSCATFDSLRATNDDRGRRRQPLVHAVSRKLGDQQEGILRDSQYGEVVESDPASSRRVQHWAALERAPVAISDLDDAHGSLDLIRIRIRGQLDGAAIGAGLEGRVALSPRAHLRGGLLRSWLLGDCEVAGSAGNPEDDESEAFACKPWEPFDQAAVLTVVGKGDPVGGFRVVHAL